MQAHPSGQQFEIENGPAALTAVEVGGGLRSFRSGDQEILDGYSSAEMCHDARGDVLIPWPNRTAGGRYRFNGTDEQLPINEPSHHNSIHGLVRWTNWSLSDRSESSVTLTHALYPQPGYPFALALQITYTLSDSGLETRMEAANSGSNPCPFGAGQHPYIKLGTGLINDLSLTIPARSMYRYNDDLIPTQKIPARGTDLDFQTGHPIGTTEINMDYTDLERGPDGRVRVTLEDPFTGRSVAVWMDESFRHATVYTGETVQPPDRRRHGLAVEPMTCPPNALVTGEDLIVLQPGESWTGRWGIEVRGF